MIRRACAAVRPALGLALLLALPAAARAGSPVRYALVVGNDRADPRVVDLEPLRHAEREAREIAADLVRYGNFDAARVETVVGGGRAEVLAAARRLAERHRQDRAELGALPTLFAFFFTGHGLAGKLVTADGALTGPDLGAIVSQLDTTLTVGFFDACYAGSLPFDALRGKGLTVTPGFNPVRELPREILDSEGTMWFVSSRAGEVSYEDERMGGLFMHFFGEAFTQADLDGVGISLETMWEYARRRTAEVAAAGGRVQTPEKIVRSLKARGPLYFSFPRPRSAALRFEAPVAGSFLVQYVNADLTEKVEKRAGAPLEVAAFEGTVVIRPASPEGSALSQRFTLRRGDLVVVRPQDAAPGRQPLGWAETRVRAKGELPGLVLTRTAAASKLALGVGWRFGPLPGNAAGAAQALAVEARLLRGALAGGLELGYGRGSRRYPAWSYDLWQADLRGTLAYGLDLSRLRLELEAGAGPALTSVHYRGGGTRQAWGGWLGGGARAVLPIPGGAPRVLAWARVSAGLSLFRGIAEGDDALRARLAPQVTVGISAPFGVGREPE